MPSLGGALNQLVSLGLADGVLTAKPVITYWRHVIKRYTNFALEAHDLDFNQGTAQFGSNPSCNLDRIGDLVYWMYVRIELPGIGMLDEEGKIIAPRTPEEANPLEPYWTYDVGQAIIEKTQFFIGGQAIDEIFGEFLYIWEELSGAPGKRLIEMVGKYEIVEALQALSRQPRILYVPLYFWFTLNSGLALPLVSLQFHSVKVQVKFRPFNELLKLRCAALDASYTLGDIQLRPKYIPTNWYAPEPQPASDLKSLTSSDMGAQIMVTYVYLDQNERAKFAEGAFESVIPQHQAQFGNVDQTITAVGVNGKDRPYSMDLNFNHTVMELFWVVRRRICGAWPGQKTEPCTDLYNEWFNFNGPPDSVTGCDIDPVVTVQLLLNNANRWEQYEGRYFRLVQPYQHHTNIPVRCIYTYSFALQPQDIQPSGTCNFSRIDSTKLNFVIDGRMFYGPSPTNPQASSSQWIPGNDYNSSVDILVFATNWNVLRFKYGLGGLRFAN